jgi:hypothetical protein
MRNPLAGWFVLIVLTSTTATAGDPIRPEIGALGWLAGHWRAAVEDAVIEEGWLGPAGGTMLGVNRTLADDRTVGFEFLRLEERDGGIVLFASPGGRFPATEFTMIEQEGQRAVFANPDHDFPQRITYRREGDRLHAEIEGAEAGEKKKIGWVFELVP